jgi:3-oxoacyl-[acyl-carrier protein] reductase
VTTAQIALVTGAAGGFGTAICASLLDVGYHVVATDVNPKALEGLVERLENPENLTCMQMDVCDLDNVQSVIDTLEQQPNSTLSVLVNNAGIISKNFCLQEQGPIDAKRIIDVNLIGAINCASVVSRVMGRQRYGRIINIASVAGIWGASGGSAYAASKAGLIKASESWARELGPLNIVVTAIAPGICITNMLGKFVSQDQMSDAAENKVVKSIVPIGRFGNPDDISEVVTFLATCKTNYINGAVIEIDGGMRVGQL